MIDRSAVVLLSGGIDSSTTLAIAKSEGFAVHALSFDYHQRHKRELHSAGLVASALGVTQHLTIQFDLRDIGGSALTSDMEVPKNAERIVSAGSIIPATYVPARNTIFLSFALAWAEVLKAENIFIGANAIDYSGYPDCRPEYLSAFEKMANLATKASAEGSMMFTVRAPLLSMKKGEIIKIGLALGLDYSLTWSCYDPQPGPARLHRSIKDYFPDRDPSLCELSPCRKCDSCIFREKGFQEAGAEDPLITD